jgi:hypothetical protein
MDIDCTLTYKPDFLRPYFKKVLDYFRINYTVPNCQPNKFKRDLVFLSITFVILFFALLLIFLILNFMRKCCKKSKSSEIMDLNNDALLRNGSNQFLNNKLSPQLYDEQNRPNEVDRELNLKILERRLEMQEFYRRLLVNQMVKREKLEESNVEKVGNLLRNGVNYLFGDPRRGLDFTDPEAMFHPYWPERKDYSLLTAYGAVREHMMHDSNLFAQPPATTEMFAPSNNVYEMPRYTGAKNNDLTRNILNNNNI